MNSRRIRLAVLLPAALLIAAAPNIRSEEGMWTFDNPPLKLLKAKYNFVPTQAWLDHLRLSSVRLNDGGSGSFVSADGLLLTNHHVARGQLQKNSTAEHDYLRDGFYATTPEQEMKSPDLEVERAGGRHGRRDRACAGRGQGHCRRREGPEGARSRDRRHRKREQGQDRPALRRGVVFTRAASIGSISTRNTPMCAWSLRPSSRPHFTAAIRITLPIRATTWTWRCSASMTTASRCTPITI